MTIAIRPAGADDLAALVDVDSFAQANAGRRDEIAHWVESGACFIAERDGEIVGYCVLTRNFFHSFFVELLMVHEPERGEGIGTEMLAYLVELVPPGEKLWTSTNASNAPMRRLVERLGFIESGRIDNLDEGDPELVFVRL
ncbi:MAG: GNAT family N-acetyltransferase [Pseudomonadota bacterium]|nr:GNAT family N-acetyltransferase [Pseudomonadota bacterium]